MLKKVLIVIGCAGALGIGGIIALFALIYKDLWWHQDLLFKRLGTLVSADLNGLGSVDIPVTFKPVGLIGPHTSPIGGRGQASLAAAPGATRITWRFVQGQYNDAGGYPTDPCLIDVTLFSPELSRAEIEGVTGTTMNRFYSPTDDAPKFADLIWSRREAAGSATVRAAGVDDVYTAGHPPRWLVIQVDPERRVRVDLYAWKSEYKVDAAVSLARSVAASVRPAPAALAAFFADSTAAAGQ